jgi:hypothetical protein
MTLLDHLERHLGPAGAKVVLGEGVQVLEFAGRPRPGATTFVSVGLSETAREGYRQELVFCCDDGWRDAGADVVATVAEEITKAGRPLRHHGLVGLPRPIGTTVALIAYQPVYFPDGFATHETVNLTWLVPLTPAEARQAGRTLDERERLLDRFTRENPDLLDLAR